MRMCRMYPSSLFSNANNEKKVALVCNPPDFQAMAASGVTFWTLKRSQLGEPRVVIGGNHRARCLDTYSKGGSAGLIYGVKFANGCSAFGGDG